jgi:hypothetical protein
MVLRPKPLTQVGDKNHEQILYEVGRALSAWEGAEQGFAKIFAKLVHPVGSGFAAQRAYGEIIAIPTKRQMIESAAEVFFRNFPDPVSSELENLMEIYGTAAGRRNDIAHGIPGGDRNDAGEIWSFLVPNTWGSKSRDMHLQIAYRYSSKQIQDYTSGFNGLGNQAFQLVEALDQIYRSAPEKSRAPY